MTPIEIINQTINHSDWDVLKIEKPEIYRKLSQKAITNKLHLVLPYYNEWQWALGGFKVYNTSLPGISNCLQSLDLKSYDYGLNEKHKLTETFFNKCICYGASEILKHAQTLNTEDKYKIINLINRTFKLYFSERNKIIKNLKENLGFDNYQIDALPLLSFIPFQNHIIGLEWIARRFEEDVDINILFSDWLILLYMNTELFMSESFLRDLKDLIGDKTTILIDKLLIKIAHEGKYAPLYKAAIKQFGNRMNRFKKIFTQFDVIENISLANLTFQPRTIKFGRYQYKHNFNLSLEDLEKIKENLKSSHCITILTAKQKYHSVYNFEFLFKQDEDYILNILNISSVPSKINIHSGEHQIERFKASRIIAEGIEAPDLDIRPGIICYKASDGIIYHLRTSRIKKSVKKSILSKIRKRFTLVKDKVFSKGEKAEYRFYFNPPTDLSYLLAEVDRLDNKIQLRHDMDYPMSGEFLLPWKYVHFFDGIMYLYHPQTLENDVIQPFHFKHSGILKSFKHLLPYIEARCPMFKVKSSKGIITEILNFEGFLRMIPQFKEWNQDSCAISYSNTNYNTQIYTIDSIKRIAFTCKSPYLELLASMQLKNYKIYYLLETILHASNSIPTEEFGYLFVLKEDQSRALLLFENTSDCSRSSLIFYVNRDFLFDAIERIKIFLSSSIENKRQKLAQKTITFAESYMLNTRRIGHDNLAHWKSQLIHLCNSLNSSIGY